MMRHTSSGLVLLVAAGPALLLLLLLAQPQPSAGEVSAVERSKREPVPEPAALTAAAGKSPDKDEKKPAAAANKKAAGGKKGSKNAKAGGKGAKKGGKKANKNKQAKGGKKSAKKGKGNKEKSGKSGKKSGKGKKNKSGKKKSGKKGAKKGGKKGSKKGGRKLSNSRKNGKIGGISGEGRQQADACVADLITILTPVGTTYSNIFRQAIRIRAGARNQENKNAKNTDFRNTSATLLSALGGNSSSNITTGNFTCGGTRLPRGNSSELQNLEALNACEKSVSAVCSNASIPEAVNACNTTAFTYIAAVAPILRANQTPAQICAAVTAFNKVLLTQLSNCTKVMTDFDREMTTKRNNCSAAFGACRQAQRTSIGQVSNCKPGPGGVANVADATAQLAVASSLKNAAVDLENKVGGALAASGLAAGPGSDGQEPAATGGRKRRQQATTLAPESAACTEVLTGLETSFNAAQAAASNAVAPLDAGSASTATTAMGATANRPNLVGDLRSCKKETPAGSRQTITIAIIRIRIFFFRIGRWRITVIEIKITLIQVSFPQLPTPVPVTPNPTTPVTVVTAAGIRRERIFQLLNNRIQLH